MNNRSPLTKTGKMIFHQIVENPDAKQIVANPDAKQIVANPDAKEPTHMCVDCRKTMKRDTAQKHSLKEMCEDGRKTPKPKK
jgi:hypothetical protein